MYGQRNGVEFLRKVPFHKCTDEDYDQFYPVKRQSADLLKQIREDPERGLFCIDWNDEDEPIEIAGYEYDANYTRLDIMLVPCNYYHPSFDYTGDTISHNCNPNLTEQINYLGASKFIIYTNEERINAEKFGDEAIEKFSKIVGLQFDENRPNWIDTKILMTEFDDQTDFLQYGQNNVKNIT